MQVYNLLGKQVSEVMTENVISVQENSYLKEVNEIFENNSIHHIPVINEQNELKGMISKTDFCLLKHWASDLNLKKAKSQNEFLFQSQLAEDIMKKKVVSVEPTDTLEKCADLFKSNYFHALPVTINGKLVGIITTFDLINIAFTRIPVTN